MSFDKLKTDISFLLTAMQNEPQDAHEIYLQIREKLSELKAFGMPLPEDLVRMEQELEAEFASDSAG
ncbi:MAG TPA: hypothetical protein PKD49_06840 [Hyphomicrobium sp.]|nr:hypothetical protein [Hyphomicrobium sp.]